MRRPTMIVIAALCALLTGVAVSSAVTVYTNPFNERGQVGEMRKLGGGKACGRSWVGRNAFGGVVRRGQTHCRWRTPVRSDRARPNHFIRAVASITRRTTGNVRRSAYIGVALRANREDGYELRVFPSSRRWQVLRNGEVATRGTDPTIGRVGQRNRLQLTAEGRGVRAAVNGTRLASFNDPGFQEVAGRGTLITFGNRGRSNRDARARFGRVVVGLTGIG